MSFLLGHQKKQKPEYTGLAIQTSNSAVPISIGMGLNRAAPNIIWQDDFKSHGKSAGGKGGGGKGSKTYTYSGSFVLSLGWGPAATIVNTWKDQSKTAGYSPFTLILGNIPQAPWGYLTTNHPSAALGYPGLILACVANLDLGSSNTLSQFSFEVQWPLYNTAPGGKGDADPAQCVDNLLNSSIYGALLGASMQLDFLFSTGAATTTGDDAWQTYCKAMGFGMSPLLDTQEVCLDILTRWTTLFNADLSWTGYSVGFLVRGADTITANGVTYLPDNTIEFALTFDNGDFLASTDSEPVRLRRARRSTLPSYGYLEIRNRSNDYNTEPSPWDDQGLIDEFGPIPNSDFTAHEICEPSIGVICAQLYGQRLAYAPNQFEFETGPGFMAMVPGSKGTITDPKFGTQTVKVVDMVEQDDGSFQVLVEEWAPSIGRASTAVPEAASNTPINTEVAAAAVNTPMIFEPPSTLAGSTPQIWMAVSGGPSGTYDPNWGGCFVWLSTDNVSFAQVGEIDAPARMGVLTTSLASYGGANPDTIDTFGVNLAESNGSLTSVSATDAANFVSGCAIQDTPGGVVEFISFRDATLTSANHYTLGGQLYRGLYSSTASGHLSAAAFARLDDQIFKVDLPAQFINQTVYVKLQSFNIFGGGVQDLASCTVYTYIPRGTGFGGGSGGVPTTPTGLTATPSTGFNSLAWTANPASDNVTRYDVYRAAGLGAAFGTATLIGNSSGASYVDGTAVATSAYTYFVKAVNVVGSSAPSSGANCTSSATASQPFGFAFEWPNPTVSKPIAYFKSPLAWAIPIGATDSQGAIGDSDTATAAAPSAQTDFDIQSPPGSSIGTMRFAASSLTATFIMGAGHSIALAQGVEIVAPSNLNGLAGMVYGTLKGTR